MPKKRETADDIETKLKRMRARKVGEAEFSTSQEYSGVYRFVVESLDKGKKIFYSSSACMYPAYNQEDPDNPKCSEDTACRIQDVRCRISAMRVLPQSVSLSLDRSTLDKPK